jgi:hypothetical protein
LNYGANTGVATLDKFVEEIDVRGAAEPQRLLSEHLSSFLSSILVEANEYARSKHVEDLFLKIDADDRAGKHILAADTMLNYVVDLLDLGDFASLAFVLNKLRRDLMNIAPENQEDYNLSRVHSVLALTYRHTEKVNGRTSLRNEYHSIVSRREGQRAADDAISNL